MPALDALCARGSVARVATTPSGLRPGSHGKAGGGPQEHPRQHPHALPLAALAGGVRTGILGIRGTSTEFERMGPGQAVLALTNLPYIRTANLATQLAVTQMNDPDATDGS